MTHIELQLPVGTYLNQLVRLGFSRRNCVPEFVLGGTTLHLAQAAPEGSARIRSVPESIMVTTANAAQVSIAGSVLEVDIDVRLHLVSQQAFDSGPTNLPPAEAFNAIVTATYTVTASVAPSQVDLSGTLTNVELSSDARTQLHITERQAPAYGRVVMGAAVSAGLSLLSMSIPMSTITNLTGRPVLAAGIALGAGSRSHLVIGLQLGLPAAETAALTRSGLGGILLAAAARQDVADWSAFYSAGGTAPIASAGTWAITMTAQPLLDAVSSELAAALRSVAGFHLADSQPVTARWSSRPNGAQIALHAEGSMDAPGSLERVGVHTDVVVLLDASMGQLRLSVHADWGVNGWDVFASVAELVLLPGWAPLVAASPRVSAPWYQVIAVWAVPIVAAILWPVAVGGYRPAPWAGTLPGACTQLDDHNAVCIYPLGLAGLNLTGVSSTSATLTLTGAVPSAPMVRPSELTVVRVETLDYVATGDCGTGYDVVARARVVVSNTGGLPLFICRVTGNEWPYNGDPPQSARITYPTAPILNGETAVIHITATWASISVIADQTDQSPAGILTVETTGGIRRIDIGAPPVPEPAIRTRLLESAALRCDRTSASSGSPMGLHLGPSLPDPAPRDLERYRTSYDILVTNTRSVQLLNPNGDLLLQATMPTGRKAAIVTATVASQSAAPEIKILLEPAAPKAGIGSVPAIAAIRRRRLAGGFPLPASGGAHHPTVALHDDTFLVGAPTPGGAAAWIVDRGSFPQLVVEVPDVKLRGVVNFNGQLLAYGGSGLRSLVSASLQPFPDTPQPITAATVTEFGLVIADGNGVSLLDPNLEVLSTIPGITVTRLVAVGRHIVAALPTAILHIHVDGLSLRATGKIETPSAMIDMCVVPGTWLVGAQDTSGIWRLMDAAGENPVWLGECSKDFWITASARQRDVTVVNESAGKETSSFLALYWTVEEATQLDVPTMKLVDNS
jgi:hypothetical protein